MRDIFVGELAKGAKKNQNIMLLTGDLGFGVFDQFQKDFPGQFINAGLSEQHMTGMAAGLAKEGKTVFTYSIGNFPTLRALEQIRIDIAYHEVPVIVVCIGGGFSYGQLGMSHHAVEDLSTMRAMPNMDVFAPCDDWEVVEITKALLKKPRSAYLRLDKSSAGNTRKRSEKFNLGAMRTIRSGKDVTLIATGGILEEVLAAADELKQGGIKARVLSAHSLKPFDEKTILKAVKETGGIVTVEEHVIQGGLAGAVSETCLRHGISPKKYAALGLDNKFPVVVGAQSYLRSEYKIDEKAIIATVRKLLK